MRPRTVQRTLCHTSRPALPTGADRRRTWPWGRPRCTRTPGARLPTSQGSRGRGRGMSAFVASLGYRLRPCRMEKSPLASRTKRKLQSPCESQARPCKSVTQLGTWTQGALRVPLSSRARCWCPRPGTQHLSSVLPPRGAHTLAPHPGGARRHRYAGPASLSFPPEASREKQSLSRSPLLPPR